MAPKSQPDQKVRSGKNVKMEIVKPPRTTHYKRLQVSHFPKPRFSKNTNGFLSGSFANFPKSRGGYVNQNTSNLFAQPGNNGVYWSSTPYSNSSNAYELNFNSTGNINPSDNWNRNNGLSVRCLLGARSPQTKLKML